MNSPTKIIIGALIIIAIVFYGGFKYGQGQTPASSQNNGSSSLRGGFAPASPAGRRQSFSEGGGMARGEIIKKDAQSLTIALLNGGSQIIWYSTSTEIQKTATGNAGDLVIGQTASITGSTNADGSLTAKSIQLR